MPYVKVADRKKATYSAEVLAKYSKDKHAPFHCNECDKVCQSEPSLVMHHRRSHGGMMAPGQLANDVDNAILSGDRKVNGNELAVHLTEEPKAKRKWTRRQPEQIVQQGKGANFCPCCGLNLQAINYALACR